MRRWWAFAWLRGAAIVADRPARRVVFIGLSAAGHGGIQGFNRRVIDALCALGVPSRTLMLSDHPGGDRRRFAMQVLGAARSADVLLIGHINLLPFALLHRLLRPGGRVILFAHGIEVWGDAGFRAVRRWEPVLLRAAIDTVAVVSHYSRTRMAQAFGLPSARFHHFPNAVDLAPPSRRAIRAPIVLAVSRLGAGERGKNVDQLIRVLPMVPDARLVVIGDGPLRVELERLAASIGVGDRVELRGSVDARALALAYQQASMFALPSSKEGFGIVFLEAWSHGLPVIGANSGGAGEVIDHGIDGFAIDPADLSGMAAAVQRLLDDPALAARMGEAGRRKVEARYSNAAFVANLRTLLAC